MPAVRAREPETAIKMMSRRGWRKREPGYIGRPERPSLLSKAVAKLYEGGFTSDDLLTLTRLSESRLNAVIGSEQAGEITLEPEELLA